MKPSVIALALLLVAAPGWTSSYPLEDYAAGVEAAGIAGWCAVLGPPAAVLGQPAALGFAELSEVGLNAADTGGLSGRIVGHYGLTAIKPMRTESATLGRANTLATLAFSLQRLDYSAALEGSEAVAAISVGAELSEGLSVGLNLKTLSVEYPQWTDSGFGLDLGLQGRFGDLLFGATALNLIPPGLETTTGRTVCDRRLALGVGWEPLPWLAAAAEALYLPTAGDYDYGPALRLIPVDDDFWRLTLSGGYRIEDELWAAGAVLHLGYLEVAAALSGRPDEDPRTALRLTLIPEF